MKQVTTLIIGAGPTGLGAATRLWENGREDWQVIDALDHFGGLAATFVDDQGFTWDQGGHVQFSHYETFDRYMNLALGEDGWLHHQRESWVWIRGQWVPYPFQNNLHRLPPAERWECVRGLLEAWQRSVMHDSGNGIGEDGNGAEKKAVPESPVPKLASRIPKPVSRNFEDWMLSTFGRGITELFMAPYNFKVWAIPPSGMDYRWIGERVAVPGIKPVIQSICLGEDQVAWGPNATFRFPKQGGTGAVWNAIGKMLPPERVSLSTRVTAIDPVRHSVTLDRGETLSYNHLISTIPLNHLIRLAPGVVDASKADKLRYSATNVVGVGLEGPTPDHLRTKCWMYFPEANSPYYRVTVFSNYSPNNVPRPGEQWSLMTETSESSAKPVNGTTLVEETIRALVEDGLIPDPGRICSKAHYRLDQGYPTPFLGRDALVDPALRAFEQHDIYSRGRFGAWKYEVANQDHSFAQGYECVERLLAGGGPESEPTLFTPDVVNSRRNP